MNLHLLSTLSSSSHLGYPNVSGVLKDEAIHLLRSFYERENFHAPDEKRKRKGISSDLQKNEVHDEIDRNTSQDIKNKIFS